MPDEGYFGSGDNQLAYSCAIPAGEAKKVGILFVHAAGGNRLGPHRMFVELARGFNLLGYPVLRFDLSGCGDSEGDISRGDMGEEIADVAEAVRFFAGRAKLESVILFGISRGSRVCYGAMEQGGLPLAGMILLSIPMSSRAAAIKSFKGYLKEYILKLRDRKRIWKLLSGKADWVEIRRTLAIALQLKDRYGRIEKKRLVSKCPILFVYGGGDPIAAEASRYYSSKCRENELSYDCHVIPDANHSFFHYKWTEEIFGLSKKWLERISG